MHLANRTCVLLQAHQDSGEFIVLNAGAYHSGYNQVPIIDIVAQVSGCDEGLLLCQ